MAYEPRIVEIFEKHSDGKTMNAMFYEMRDVILAATTENQLDLIRNSLLMTIDHNANERWLADWLHILSELFLFVEQRRLAIALT